QMLIKKGQVTARTIVRGPTTHQLWRFAAHVKGVSREFGLCHGCGAEIETTANICPKCQRLQEPPVNPDVLLETRQPQVTRATVMREVRPAPEDIVIPPAGERQLPDPVDLSVPQVPTEQEFSRTPLSSDHLSPMTPPTPRPTGQEILTPKELAAVFQLNLPSQDQPTAARRPFRMRRLIAAAALIILLLGSAYLIYDQAARKSVMAWAEQTYTDIRQMLAPSKVVAQPEESASPTTPPPAASPVDQPTAPVAPPTPPVTPATLIPAPKHDTPVAQTPAPKVEPPKTEPEPTLNDPSDPDEVIQQARILWRNAITAEANGDYALAVKYYEQIKKLPPVAWPGGLDLRLEDARRHLRR
ncbi:MAG: hypothetical protein IT447_13025, partial [Phycisphaerales bacterium]|nr:hypothetical protein [Phycisphaerales bacterium]